MYGLELPLSQILTNCHIVFWNSLLHFHWHLVYHCTTKYILFCEYTFVNVVIYTRLSYPSIAALVKVCTHPVVPRLKPYTSGIPFGKNAESDR